ncbi:hypothetical protein QFZ74_003181 [Streptomyces sp. V3I7]|nr:hypothetical protein [Streptomyces sp. V3I7]
MIGVELVTPGTDEVDPQAAAALMEAGTGGLSGPPCLTPCHPGGPSAQDSPPRL